MIVGTLLVLVGGAAALLWRPVADSGDEGRLTAQADSEVASDRYPESPVPLVSDTEYVETKVLKGGDLLVAHWIRTSLPMNQLSVTVPTRPGLTDQAVGFKHFVVEADGVRTDSPKAVSEVEWAGVLPATRDLYVRYQLTGVLQRSSSAEGRALATMTVLNVGVGHELLAKTQLFRGAQVLTLACLSPGAEAVPRPCGTLNEEAWTVVSEGEAVEDIVIAQFDLVAD